MKRTFYTGVALLFSFSPLHAANWTESLDGDLSNNSAAPTALTFAPGVNLVTGRMGKPDSRPLDPDFFTFTLAPGWSLTSIEVLSISLFDNSFYAIAAGTSINTSNPATHLSNTLISGAGEYLDDLALPNAPYFGGTGLTAPLGAGTYTVWFQEAAIERDYQMAYTVVPEPGTTCSLLGGAATLLHLRRRRDRRA